VLFRFLLFRRELRIAAGLVVGLAISGMPAFAQLSLAPGFLPANELALQNYSAEFPPIGVSYSSMRPALLADYMARQLREMPNALETFETAVLMERADLAADALGRIIRDRPEDAAWAFDVLARRNIFRYNVGIPDVARPGVENPLPALIAEGRRQLTRLTAAAAARLELALIYVEPETSSPAPNTRRADALRALIATYPGTDAALEAEVDLLMSTTSRAMWIQPLDEFAKQHPDTTAAAKALSEKAFQIARNLNSGIRDVNLGNPDPTDAYLDVLGIVTDLRSGRYPASPWVARAPYLGIELSPRSAQFTPGNVERLLAGYIDFVKAHFTLPANSQMAEGVNSVVTRQIFDLFERSGEGIAGVERTLTELEGFDALRARYLRGAFYVSRLADATTATRPALLQKAIDALSELARGGSGLYSRRALATLASVHYEEGNLTAARAAFTDYLAANPDTPWSWVAAIRIGQCHQLLGDLDQAIAAFRAAAARYASIPLARELGHAFAGRASEAASRFEEAAVEYQQALERWGDLRRAARMETYARAGQSGWTFVDVQGLFLKTRLDQIRAALATTEGVQLERARWLAASNDRVGALAALDAFGRAYPKSTLAPDARKLLRRTHLDLALEQAGPANAPRDEAGAVAALTAVDDQPWDEVAGVTQIVAATLTFRRGLRDQADAMIVAAIRDWQNNQTISPPTLPIPIADDVAAIRGRIFALEGQNAWWSSSVAARRSPDAVIVFNPHITVQLFEAVPTRETVYPASAPKSALFMSSDAMELLVGALNRLGESLPERPSSPRVPREMGDFVSDHLPAEMGMLCCQFTSFASVPNVQGVTFTNAERTRATAAIRTYSSGGVLLFEKTGNNWRVVGGGQTYVN
jgi:tetratricopeptide (TPR) repeat protein